MEWNDTQEHNTHLVLGSSLCPDDHWPQNQARLHDIPQFVFQDVGGSIRIQQRKRREHLALTLCPHPVPEV